MLRRIPALAVLCVLALCGCDNEPTVDATNEETLQKSVEAISKPMEQAERVKFQKAVGTLVMARVIFTDDKTPPTEEVARQRVKAALHGKTAGQIMADADRVSDETKKQMEALAKP